MDTTVCEEKADTTDTANDSDDRLRLRLEELKLRIESLNDRVKGFIKEHPTACLVGALGLGYLVAHLARRRS